MYLNDGEIQRKDTAIRLVISLILFFLIRMIEVVLVVLTIFSLAYALITKSYPSHQVMNFANNTINYLYRILRYLTFSEDEPPFPFSEFTS